MNTRMHNRLAAAAMLVALGVPAAQAQTAPSLDLMSQVMGVALARITDLPQAPEDAGDAEWCSHLVIDATTPGGLSVEDRGWAVTSEVELSEVTLVSFVAGFEAGTSGSCALRDGNVGIFSGTDLVGVAYAPTGSPLSIGHLHPFGADGARIWSGDFLSMPVADIALYGGFAVAVRPLAAEETFCGDAASVPNIYGDPIAEARETLAASGWNPREIAESEDLDSRSREYRALGLVELEGCSGTGFGFCSFAYEGPAGTLSVTTVGEGEEGGTPTVSSYGVTCNGQ